QSTFIDVGALRQQRMGVYVYTAKGLKAETGIVSRLQPPGISNHPSCSGSKDMTHTQTADQTLLMYIQTIRSAEKLTDDETADLIQRAKNGDADARSRVCNAYFDTVFYCVKNGNYSQNNSDTADFLQEGSIGLLKAIEHFSPKKGAAFSTYAPYWINKYLWDYCRRNQFIIKPDKKFRLLAKLAQTEMAYETAHGKTPPVETLAEQLSLSPDEIRKLKAEQKCFCIFAEDAFQDSSESGMDEFLNKLMGISPASEYINCGVEDFALEEIHAEELYRELISCFGNGIDRNIIDIILLSEEETVSHAKIAGELSFSRAYISNRIRGMRTNVKNIMLKMNPDLNPDSFHAA
ncbi:MAG: sigma-70 family RNA polymerase sigma factor, partial [Lachnospiraceae bacterium]|nr:sigma-70 family RNA polymerase sigma factor [Lachnospiraceae bacterium]